MTTQQPISAPHRLVVWSALALSALAIVLVALLWAGGGQHRIAVVRSSALIQGYKAMKDAQERYDNKQKAWQANIAMLEEDLQTSFDTYKVEYARLSSDEVRKREEQIEQKRANYVQYSQAIEEKAAKEENEMMQGVLNRINSFVEKYGKEHGYDVIFGTTAAGSVLYGDRAVDITDEVLRALNNDYVSGAGEAENVSQ